MLQLDPVNILNAPMKKKMAHKELQTNQKAIHLPKVYYNPPNQNLTNDTWLAYWPRIETHLVFMSSVEESNDEQQGSSTQPIPKRKNNTYSHSKRVRIVTAWKDEKNWKVVAENCGVKESAAHKWIQKYRELQMDEELSDEPDFPKNKPSTGREPILPKNDQEKIVEFIEEDPEITVEDLKEKIRQSFGVTVSTTTRWRYIEGQLINVKKIHYEPVTMNNLQNRVARKEFLTKLLSYEAQQKTIIYLDETNFNVFCRRAYGRSKIGDRCRSVKPASKGHNLTIISNSLEGLPLLSRGPREEVESGRKM